MNKTTESEESVQTGRLRSTAEQQAKATQIPKREINLAILPVHRNNQK